MGVGMGKAVTPWIFIHDTDNVEGDVMIYFSVLFFSVAPLEFFYRRPCVQCNQLVWGNA